MAEIHCRHFNGYKPCGLHSDCNPQCPSLSKVGERILIVHLEALGAVLRSTSLLAAIKRKFPRSHITWVTKAPAHHLLNGCDVDRVLTTGHEDLVRLNALRFDIVYCIDKSLLACSIAGSVTSRSYFGFKADPFHGAILPANPESIELWEIGLNNQKKFFDNKKTEQQLVHEALCLDEFSRDKYALKLSAGEHEEANVRRRQWARPEQNIIGLNTGCSPVIPYKKMSVEGQREIIRSIRRSSDSRVRDAAIVLLGGPEDTERNQQIAQGLNVIESPTTLGLRDGLVSMATTDIVVSGDSLGMHMAIGLGKWSVVWFGPTCEQEIDLYDRGVKILASVGCAPCWKRSCHKQVMCYDQVNISAVMNAIEKGIDWHTSSSKPHIPEISF
jgi:heptosyltransferase-2